MGAGAGGPGGPIRKKEEIEIKLNLNKKSLVNFQVDYQEVLSKQ